MPSILLVCTGNICRSPMAGALFERLVPEAERENWRVETAGTWAAAGLPPSKNSVIVMEKMGLDIHDHRSKSVGREMLAEFDLILTMEAGQKEALGVEFPEVADRVFMLSEMTDEKQDVEDPIGNPIEDYEEAAEEIDSYLTEGYNKIVRLIEENRHE